MICGVFLFFFVIGVVATVFWLTDFGDMFYRWQGRVHIGRWTSDEQWSNAVKRVCLRWLKCTPYVRKTDQTRMILWDILKGNYKSATIQYWQEAGLLLGLRDEDQSAVDEFQSKKIGKDGNWATPPRQVEAALLAYSILTSTPDDDLIKPAMDTVYDFILDLKGDGNTVPYRKNVANIRFVDTLGMICPFLILYGETYKVPEAVELSIKQLEEYNEVALLPTWRFPAHAFDVKTKAPMGIFDWGRGIGWYVVALLGMWKSTRNDNTRRMLSGLMLQLASKMVLCQRADGGFSSQIFNKNMCVDASATVLAGLLYVQCYRISKDRKFKEVASNVIKCLKTLTQRSGCVDSCQGDTKGIGIYSNFYGYMPFAQGLTLLLINSWNDYS